MNAWGEGGSKVQEGQRDRLTLEQDNAALRVALAQALEDLAMVEEIAQVATNSLPAPARAAVRCTTPW